MLKMDRTTRASLVPCVVYVFSPNKVGAVIAGLGEPIRRKRGRPRGPEPHEKRKRGKKSAHTGNVYVHPDYGRKIKRSGAPKDSPPCPRARRYGYQFEYKSSSRLIYVRKANNRVTADEQAHHTRAAASLLNPISEGYTGI